jgi:hypothetical protein
MLAFTDRELAMLRDPPYQAARLEVERCLARGQRVPERAIQQLKDCDWRGPTNPSWSCSARMCPIDLGNRFVIKLPDDLERLLPLVWLRPVPLKDRADDPWEQVRSTPV